VDLTGAALLSLLLMAVALFAWWLQTRLVGEKRSPASPANREKTVGRRWAG
jgi:ABC-type Fe3+ transport system permease subunit